MIRGNLTEGRYVVLEMNGYALTDSHGTLTATKATSQHNSKAQRFVMYQSDDQFSIKGVPSGKYITGSGSSKLSSQKSAGSFTITDVGNGSGYTVQTGGKYLSISGGKVTTSSSPQNFMLYSVTYNN